MNHSNLDRRDFLRSAAFVPLCFSGGPLLHWLPRGDDRIFLVLELEGGNDGLNTLIPLDDDAYARARPRLSQVRGGAHRVAPGFGLHGALAGLHGLFEAGHACGIHAVGYPEPDRSHFRSRDIWHAADPALVRVEAGTTGWLGRTADWLAGRGAAFPAAAVGGVTVPLVLQARDAVVPLLQRVEDYQLLVDGTGRVAEVRRKALLEVVGPSDDPRPGGAGDLRSHIAALAAQAAAGAEKLRAALQRYSPKADYPDTPLGRHLQLVARVAVAGTGTRLFHTAHGGFDTHARQLPAHDGLLRQLGDALAAFAQDLRLHGMLDRTLVLVHSEFGRRVAENQSQGTDHGAGAPVFLVGGGVAPGLHGAPPDLGALVDGDVPQAVDFRRVYVEVLRWLGVEGPAVLPGAFEPVGALDRSGNTGR